jgi:hypothetical protein
MSVMVTHWSRLGRDQVDDDVDSAAWASPSGGPPPLAHGHHVITDSIAPNVRFSTLILGASVILRAARGSVDVIDGGDGDDI